MAHDVFISYSHNDQPVADAICHTLESNGIRCWYAPRNIDFGLMWAGSIVRAIRECTVFILLYSDSSNASSNVLNEVANAADNDCIIIPFRIDRSEMNDDLVYYLNSRHWLDAVTPPLQKHIDDLCHQVSQRLSNQNDNRHLAHLKEFLHSRESVHEQKVPGREHNDEWKKYEIPEIGMSIYLPPKFTVFLRNDDTVDDDFNKYMQNGDLYIEASTAGRGQIFTLKVKEHQGSGWVCDDSIPEFTMDHSFVWPDGQNVKQDNTVDTTGRVGNRKFMRIMSTVGDPGDKQIHFISYCTVTSHKMVWFSLNTWTQFDVNDLAMIQEIARRAVIQ